MSWLRGGILVIAAVLAQGASRNATSIPGSTGEITAAREALLRAEAAHGDGHPVTAFMLSNLALAMREAGYFNYAEHYAHQALGILERHFGPTDVSLVPALNVLAEAAASQAQYTQAAAFADRAISIGPDAGAHYGTALHNRAAIYQAQGDFERAAELYRRALAVREQVLPAGHPFIQLTRAALEQVRRSAKVTAHQ